jgi:hypothetical protein
MILFQKNLILKLENSRMLILELYLEYQGTWSSCTEVRGRMKKGSFHVCCFQGGP